MVHDTLGINFLGGWPLLFSREWWALYTVRGVWLPSHLPLEVVDHIHNHGPQLASRGTGVIVHMETQWLMWNKVRPCLVRLN
jgi:hypothetical protein